MSTAGQAGERLPRHFMEERGEEDHGKGKNQGRGV